MSVWRLGSAYGAAYLSNQLHPGRLNTAGLGFAEGFFPVRVRPGQEPGIRVRTGPQTEDAAAETVIGRASAPEKDEPEFAHRAAGE